ncbi:MAG: enoyl-CoA hydratase/isomerase family protein [Thermoplasmatota archaeon]
MDYRHITFDVAGGTARLVLRRPPVNILNIEMMRELNDALVRAQKAEGLRALVISAEGRYFSAGVDVGEHTKDKVREMIKVFHSIFENLTRVDAPTVALVGGTCLGGGCELALFCDIVLASERARFGQPEIKVGVFPPIAAYLLPNTTACKHAAEILLTGETYTAAEMRAMGLVNRVFPEESFESESEAFITKLTSSSSVVLSLAKRAMRGALGKTYSEAIPAIEELYLEKLMATEDASEGLAAFIGKRKPAWRDR